MSNILQFLRCYADPRIIVIGCIAYANGLALLLTSTTLAVRLKSYGLDYLSIGFFGLLSFPYTFKFLWAPFLDQVSLPFLKRYLGQRRSWLCLMQLMSITGVAGMAFLDPLENLKTFITCGFLVSLSAASQHVLLLTYQMETLKSREWGMGEGMSIFAYRMGMLTSGGGALYLATCLSWESVYGAIALCMAVGLGAVLVMQEPERFTTQHIYPFTNWKIWTMHAFVGPFKDFMTQSGWKAILGFMIIYRLPENLLISMQSLFLLDLGFTYQDIANVTKIFGLGAIITGGMMGGYWIRLYGYRKVLLWGAIMYGLSSLLLLIQPYFGTNLLALYLIIGLQHFIGGITLIGFFTYQLTCCSISFAATQLALLTSFAALSKTLSSPLAGFIVEFFGWTPYIIFICLSSILGVVWVTRIPFPSLRVER